MKNAYAALGVILCSCAIVGLCMPHAVAAGPAGDGEIHAYITTASINVTNVSLANATLPEKYKVTPSQIEVEISTNNTLDGSLKGEMAAVPRTVGFGISPELLVIVIVVIAALGIGAWYFLKRKNDRENKE